MYLEIRSDKDIKTLTIEFVEGGNTSLVMSPSDNHHNSSIKEPVSLIESNQNELLNRLAGMLDTSRVKIEEGSIQLPDISNRPPEVDPDFASKSL
jgi:hypothetical protein